MFQGRAAVVWIGDERRANGGGLSEEQIELVINRCTRQVVEIMREKYQSEMGSMKKLWSALLFMVVLGMAGGGWGASEYLRSSYASRDEVLVAGAKAEFVLDRQMETTINEIAYLERKGNLTNSELARLAYLRQQLEQMRKVRAGR